VSRRRGRATLRPIPLSYIVPTQYLCKIPKRCDNRKAAAQSSVTTAWPPIHREE